MLTLYYAPQSRALRALWMLEEIGQPYERVRVDIRAADHPRPDFLRISPLGKVPALVDGETTVAESGAILAYLAERFPAAGLAPAVGDPRRGAYLQWLFFAAGCIEPAYTQKMVGFDLGHSTAGWGSFDHVIAVMEQALTPGPWLLGEQFTAADLFLGIDLQFGQEVLKIVPALPAIQAFLERCRARPALRRAVAIDSGQQG